MKRYILFFLLIFGSFFTKSIAQNAKIVFHTDQDVAIGVNKPIDEYYNFDIAPDKLELKPNISITYEVDVVDFSFITCRYPDNMRINLLLTEGDEVILEYKNGEIDIKGDNAEGNRYLYNNYSVKGLGYYYPQIQVIFGSYSDKDLDFEAINNDLQNFRNATYRRDIDNLKTEKKITPKFGEILTNNLDYASFDLVYAIYDNLLRGNKDIIKRQITSPEVAAIINAYGKYLSDSTIMNINTLKYNYGDIFTDYYLLKYKKLDKESKEELIKGYDEDVFGAYAAFLQSPDYMHPSLFGNKFVEQLRYSYNYFDADKILAYLKMKFPQSEYIRIIIQMIDDAKKKEKTETVEKKNIVIVDNTKVNSLKDLVAIDGIKGNYVYVDLWATWCMPCLQEFQHNKEIERLFSKYENLVAVYISTDEDSLDKQWKKQVEKFDLSEYNLRASKMLQEEIVQKVYNGSSLSIPRYLLLDDSGAIIHDNLPRPSRMKLLEQTLDEKLKK